MRMRRPNAKSSSSSRTLVRKNLGCTMLVSKLEMPATLNVYAPAECVSLFVFCESTCRFHSVGLAAVSPWKQEHTRTHHARSTTTESTPRGATNGSKTPPPPFHVQAMAGATPHNTKHTNKRTDFSRDPMDRSSSPEDSDSLEEWKSNLAMAAPADAGVQLLLPRPLPLPVRALVAVLE